MSNIMTSHTLEKLCRSPKELIAVVLEKWILLNKISPFRLDLGLCNLEMEGPRVSFLIRGTYDLLPTPQNLSQRSCMLNSASILESRGEPPQMLLHKLQQ